MSVKHVLLKIVLLITLSGCSQLVSASAYKMEPFTSESLGISALAPEGWEKVTEGHYAGDEWPVDQLIFEVYPGMNPQHVLDFTAKTRLGMTEAPESSEQLEGQDLDWDLYENEMELPEIGSLRVDIALGEKDSVTYLVGMITSPESDPKLRNKVFLPASRAVEVIDFDEIAQDPREHISKDDLMAESYSDDGPVHNLYYTPVGESDNAIHQLEGKLAVEEFLMTDRQQDDNVLRPSDRYFPGFSVEFFTYKDHLVPLQRDVILEGEGDSSWNLIISSGIVWSEKTDGGMSRASFPFVLIKEDTSEAHNGIATFLYDGDKVSSFRFQVVQETAPWNKMDYWGQNPMAYSPGQIKDKEEQIAQFSASLDAKTQVRPWSDLEGKLNLELLSSFNGSLHPWEISTAGLVLDGILYLQPCRTRYGDFPYCEAMRQGSFSVAKSMGAAVAMLRLAEKFGEEVFDMKIADYVEVTADHDGWEEVTFGDALNMATGIGGDLPEKVNPNVMFSDEDGNEAVFQFFQQARSAGEKAEACFAADNYPWGPGEVARYQSCHTFILGMAMDKFLKSREGSDADVWDMLIDEVYEPIGIMRMPTLRTIEEDGSRGIPHYSIGLYPNPDDIAKIGMLMQNGGVTGGKQLLHREKLAEALREEELYGLYTGEFNQYGEGTYHMSFWTMPYQTASGDYIQIPYMSGFGGNRVILAPNGVVAFQFGDSHIYGFESMVEAAEELGQFSGQ